MAKKHMWTLAQALEGLKDGTCYDERYGYKEWNFEPCPMIVCTNWKPDPEACRLTVDTSIVVVVMALQMLSSLTQEVPAKFIVRFGKRQTAKLQHKVHDTLNCAQMRPGRKHISAKCTL